MEVRDVEQMIKATKEKIEARGQNEFRKGMELE